MKREGEQQLLRIFMNETDLWQGRPLYKVIIETLRQAHAAGCTAVRGVEGFGTGHQLHDARYESLFLNLPVIVEVVDREEKIRELIPLLDPMIRVGLMTLEAVDVEMARPADPSSAG